MLILTNVYLCRFEIKVLTTFNFQLHLNVFTWVLNCSPGSPISSNFSCQNIATFFFSFPGEGREVLLVLQGGRMSPPPPQAYNKQTFIAVHCTGHPHDASSDLFNCISPEFLLASQLFINCAQSFKLHNMMFLPLVSVKWSQRKGT